MKTFLVISGKGGTGKTVLAGSLAVIAENKVMADCDVDAADLHLLLHPKIQERHDFPGGQKAVINKEVCRACGRCMRHCRFEAITPDFVVDPFSCEGCGLCRELCRHGAIRMEESVAGEWFVSSTGYGPLVHAKLGVAEDNSGKLVAKVRQVAKELAQQERRDFVIVDGPPGIGCPVIAALSGVDCALGVTEPTLSGLHDAQRVIDVARHFRADVKMVINKYDLNEQVTAEIEAWCRSGKLPLIGRIPFEPAVVEAMLQCRTVVEWAPRSAAAGEIAAIHLQIFQS